MVWVSKQANEKTTFLTQFNFGVARIVLDQVDDIHPLLSVAPSSTEFKKLHKRLARQAHEAIDHYGMIKPSARWLICLSIGKDSYPLLAVLHELKWGGLLQVAAFGVQSGSEATRFFHNCVVRVFKGPWH